jgi:hypothetical protein
MSGLFHLCSNSLHHQLAEIGATRHHPAGFLLASNRTAHEKAPDDAGASQIHVVLSELARKSDARTMRVTIGREVANRWVTLVLHINHRVNAVAKPEFKVLSEPI